MWRIGDIVIGKLDLQGGRFTYGNRIAVGMIFSGEGSEYRKMKALHKELYGYSCRWLPLRWRVKRFKAIAEALKLWVEREQQMLDYTPTADEQAAGLDQFNAEIGSMGTIKALAKAYSKDPDEVLQWDYAKVFEILRTDLAEVKFNRRFQAVVKRKTSNGNNQRKR